MARIKLKIDQEVFNPIYRKRLLSNQSGTQIYFGGSSSGKSYAIAQRTVLDVLNGKRNYLIVRKVMSTIRGSVFNEVRKAISNFKLTEYFQVNLTDMIITCTLNGKQIRFAGLDDVEKVKSITPELGVFTDVWIEEATEVTYSDYKQLQKRLRGRSAVPKRTTLSFNPILRTHWIYVEFFGAWTDDGTQWQTSDGVTILKTTYKDNLYLEPDDIAGLENESDRYYYEVYTLGNWGVLGHVIFKNWRVEHFDTSQFGTYYEGMDWGFSPDPFAWIQASHDRAQSKIYICDEILAEGLLNNEAAPLVRAKTHAGLITADSANPQAIAEFNSLGVPTKGAKKGPGSVEDGINWLKQHEIIIHPQCVGFKREIESYKLREDKNGEALPVPVDKDNHLIDSLRYAFEDLSNVKIIRARSRKSLGL